MRKICEKDGKDHFLVSFRMFLFHGNIIFSELSLKLKCKKAPSFHKCVFLRKYEIFVYDIAGRKDENFYVVLHSYTIAERKDEMSYCNENK